MKVESAVLVPLSKACFPTATARDAPGSAISGAYRRSQGPTPTRYCPGTGGVHQGMPSQLLCGCRRS